MLGGSGERYSVECDGRKYQFSRLTSAAMNSFSVRLIQKRREGLVALYGHDRAALNARLLELERLVLDGAFDFLEPAVTGVPVTVEERRAMPDGSESLGHVTRMVGGEMNTRGGQLMLVSILAGIDEGEAMALLYSKPEEVNHVLRLVMAESFGTREQADDWKPGPAPAPSTNGEPEKNASTPVVPAGSASPAANTATPS